jgi:hypothetical protein
VYGTVFSVSDTYNVSGLLWQVVLQSEVKEEAAASRRGTRAEQGNLSQ